MIHATNTGKESAQSVKVVAKRPDNGSFYIIERVGDFNEYNNYYDWSEESSQSIDVINPGETKDVEFIVRTSEYGNNNNNNVSTLRVEVTAENMLENSTASFENNIVIGSIELKLSSLITDEDVRIGRKISYNLTSRNNLNKIKNLSITIDIPEYLNVLNCEDGNFDERTRKLTYTPEKLSEYLNYTFETEVVSSNEPNQEITLQAFGSYDGMEKQLKSNKVTKYVQDAKGFSASMSSNIEDKMIDTDTVEYYITVNNNSKKQAEVLVYDDLPDKLKLIGYTVKNGNTGYTIEDAYIEQTIKETVQPGESLRVTVTAKPYILDTVGQIENIENNVSIMVNGEKVEVNQIKQQIEGTSNFNTVQVEQINEEKENIYSISGKVWYDENSNSRKEAEEIGMPATILRLYDVRNQTLVKNEDGSILEIYTNENGEYKFDNLSKGQYIILTNYDNESYVIANYQDKELEQNEDCDFISSNSKVATTNTITIDGENIYNIDLGLVDINNFNITLTNTISKISVIDEKGTTVYDNIDKTNNIEINNIENSRLVIEYSIKVANEGNIEGYATAVENYIPEGMEFKSELNPDWYIDDKGDAINSSIANKLLLPGEEEEIRLVLIKDMNKSKGQLVHSEASIKNTYNKYGIEEIKTETNLSKIKYGVADIIVTEKENTVLQISLISISLLIVIGLIGGMTLRKYNKELKKIETI